MVSINENPHAEIFITNKRITQNFNAPKDFPVFFSQIFDSLQIMYIFIYLPIYINFKGFHYHIKQIVLNFKINAGSYFTKQLFTICFIGKKVFNCAFYYGLC